MDDQAAPNLPQPTPPLTEIPPKEEPLKPVYPPPENPSPLTEVPPSEESPKPAYMSPKTPEPLTEVNPPTSVWTPSAEISETRPQTPVEVISPPPPIEPEPKPFPWAVIIVTSLLAIIALVIFIVYRLISGQAPLPSLQARPTPTPTVILTPIATPTIARTRTFENDFIRFDYPETMIQVPLGNDFKFGPITYSMANLSGRTLENWIARNEKCGTNQSRNPLPLTTATGIIGLQIKNLGACPTGENILDVFYFTTGQTVHRLALTGSEEVSVETAAFGRLISSITLVTETRGNK